MIFAKIKNLFLTRVFVLFWGLIINSQESGFAFAATGSSCHILFGDQKIDLFSYLTQWRNFIESDSLAASQRHPRSFLLTQPAMLRSLEETMEKNFPPYQKSKHWLTEYEKNGVLITPPLFEELVAATMQQYTQKRKSEYSNLLHFTTLDTIQNLSQLAQELNQQQNAQPKEPKLQKNSPPPKGSGGQAKPKNPPADDLTKIHNRSLKESRSKSYRVHNKQMPSDSDQENIFGITLSLPVRFGYLQYNTYETIHPSGEIESNPELRGKSQQLLGDNINASAQPLAITLHNRQNAMVLAVPKVNLGPSRYQADFEPILGNYRDGYTVTEIHPEEFEVRSLTGGSLPEDIKIGLVESGQQHLSSLQLAGLSRKSRIPSDHWPSHILEGIRSAQSKTDLEEKIAALAQWFRYKGPYLYYDKGNQENMDLTVAVDANLAAKAHQDLALSLAQEKMFNCDGGALIGAILIRDFFNLPSQIVSGPVTEIDPRTGLLRVDLNAVEHAWVKVFVRDHWLTFDFTPTKNAPAAASTKIPEDQGQQEDAVNSDSKKESKDKKDEAKKNKDKEGKNSDEDSSGEKNTDQKNTQTVLPKNAAPPLSLPSSYDSPLGAWAQTLLVDILYKLKDQITMKQAPALLASSFESLESIGVAQKAKLEINRILTPFFDQREKSISDLLNEFKSDLRYDPRVARNKLLLVLGYLKSLHPLMKNTEVDAPLATAISRAEDILQELDTLKHPNSAQHDFVLSFLNSMPGTLIKEYILQQNRRAEEIGSNDQLKLFDELKSGHWATVMLASAMHGLLNFSPLSEWEPTMGREQTLLRTQQVEPQNRGLVTAGPNDLSYVSHWLLNDLSPDVDENAALLRKLFAGEQRMHGRRQMVDVPFGTHSQERTHTDIFWDASSSMYWHSKGAPRVIQIATVIALIDKIFSGNATDPMGKSLNTITLFPFDGQVHEGIFIENRQQALEKILLWLNNPPATVGKGTDLEACFTAHKRNLLLYSSDEKRGVSDVSRLQLRSGNMVLLTDGISKFDKKMTLDLFRDLKSLGLRTSIRVLTFNGKESAHYADDQAYAEFFKNLQDFVVEAKQFMEVTHLDLSLDEMEALMYQSRNPVVPVDSFMPKHAKGRVPESLHQKAEALILPGNKNSELLAELGSLQTILRQDPQVITTPSGRTAEIVNELDHLQMFFRESHLARETKLLIIAKILKNYSRWTGHELSRLSPWEFNTLQSLLKNAEKDVP